MGPRDSGPLKKGKRASRLMKMGASVLLCTIREATRAKGVIFAVAIKIRALRGS